MEDAMGDENEDCVQDEDGAHPPSIAQPPKSGFWDTVGAVLEMICASLRVLDVFG
jgi:hypothetical protein